MQKKSRLLMEKTWRLNRVHVGEETDLSMKILKEIYPNIKIHEHPTGTNVNGWVVPQAWNVKKGILKRTNGEVLADYHVNPLSLYAFSISFSGKVSREELLKHLLWNEKRPADIPFYFRNQYRHWEKTWGFCVPYNVVKDLKDDFYEVEIETKFEKGSMKTADYFLPGKLEDTIVFCGHWDHPAMINDGLGGCIAGLEVMELLKEKSAKKKLRYSYRLILAQEIVGSALYLDQNKKDAKKMKEGLFIAMPGCSSPLTMQHSLHKSSQMDFILPLLAKQKNIPLREGEYGEVVGNDEIAFEAPGYEIPMPSISRFPFDLYHTSSDNLENFLEGPYDEMVSMVLEAVDLIEKNEFPQRTFSGLPCLANPEFGLYLPPRMMSQKDMSAEVIKEYEEYGQIEDPNFCGNSFVKQVWHYLEGDLSILEISQKMKAPFPFVRKYLEKAASKGLIKFLPERVKKKQS